VHRSGHQYFQATSVPEWKNFSYSPHAHHALSHCDRPGWGRWHFSSSSSFKDTAGPLSLSQTTELTVIEAMVLVLGQDPGHQLLLQRRASRALQGPQPCSLLGVLSSCQTTPKRCYLWCSVKTSAHPQGHHAQVPSGQPPKRGLGVPFPGWIHRLNSHGGPKRLTSIPSGTSQGRSDTAPPQAINLSYRT